MWKGLHIRTVEPESSATMEDGMDESIRIIHHRNKLLIKLCFALAILGSLAAIPNLGGKALILAFGVTSFYGIPAILIWKRIVIDKIMYILSVSVIASQFLVTSLEHTIISYCFSYVITALFSLYFNYRPVLLMGFGNILYTIYSFFTYGETMFISASFSADLPPYLVTHVILTAAIVAQSIIGENMRVKSTMLEAISRTDALTGLYNHRTFHEHLERLTGPNAPSGRLQLAVIDIDNFKQINDSYGHHVGDIVLKRVADMIIRQVAAGDIVARYGGEEFTIIFMNKPMKDSCLIAERIVEAARKMCHPELDHLHATVSIGLKDYDPSVGAKELFAQADALLYEAKRSGKDKAVF